MLITDAVIHYLNDLAMRCCSKETIRGYRTDIIQFRDWLHECEIEHVEKITRGHLRRFIGSLMVSERSVCRKLAGLRSFFMYFEKTHVLSSSPMNQIRNPKTPQKMLRFLEREQLKDIVSVVNVFTKQGIRDRAVIELMYSSGFRVSELTSLNWEDIDTERSVAQVLGKGNRERVVPITKGAMRWLIRLKVITGELGPIFRNRFGGRISSRSIDRILKKLANATGKDIHISSHMIRHTIATQWMERGMDLTAVQALLGHATINTTSIYTKVSIGFRVEQMRKCHPFEIFQKKILGEQKSDTG